MYKRTQNLNNFEYDELNDKDNTNKNNCESIISIAENDKGKYFGKCPLNPIIYYKCNFELYLKCEE